MGLYQHYVVPWLVHVSMKNTLLRAYRERVVAPARGTVLEIGIGSGHNLPFYDSEQVDKVVGLEPSAKLRDLARKASRDVQFPLELVEGSAEAIALDDDSIDTAVMTWTLCSIPDAAGALAEIRRVLKPEGSLRFVEHGLADEPSVTRWQHRLDPLWWRVSCHIDRPISGLIEEAGFDLASLDTGYLARGPRVMTYMYEGTAGLSPGRRESTTEVLGG